MLAEGSASLCRSHAHLRRLRLPLSLHRRRRRALVPEPRRAPGRGGTRGDLPDTAPVAPRPARRGGGRTCRDRRAADGAVRGRWAKAHPAPARLRRGGALAPAAPRRALPRGAHGLVSLLLAARRGAGAAPAPLPARSGLARAVEPRLLARISGPRRWSHRARRAVAVPARSAKGVLLLAAARAPAPRVGGQRRAGCARGGVRGIAGAARPGAGRTGGGVCRPPHSREARARARTRARPGARADPRAARRDLRGR